MPPDYSGYTPQRQKQRQEPWADAAVGIAKLFMPDPEMQSKARQSQQQEDYNAARLKDTEAGTKWTQTRDEYDRAKLNEHGANQKLHAERAAILARAAAEGRVLNPAEAARLVAINGHIRGTVSSGEVSGFFAIPGAPQIAADKAAAEKIENKNKEDLRIKGEQEKVEARKSEEFKALHGEYSKRVDPVRLKNNLQAMFNTSKYARDNNFTLSDEAADFIAQRGSEMGYTDIEMIEAARALLLKTGMDTEGNPLSVTAADDADMRIAGEPKYSETQIAALKRNYVGTDWANEEIKYRSLRKLKDSDITILSTLTRDPKALRVRGTTEFIRQFAIKHPRKKILFFNTKTGQFGGGIASAGQITVEEGYETEMGDDDSNFQGGRLLLDWEDE